MQGTVKRTTKGKKGSKWIINQKNKKSHMLQSWFPEFEIPAKSIIDMY
jgi:hypothetical protein